MKTSDLRPCPRCGTGAYNLGLEGGGPFGMPTSTRVYCDLECGFLGPDGLHIQDAVRLWNEIESEARTRAEEKAKAQGDSCDFCGVPHS